MTKTDNHNLAAKLALRRQMLKEFPADKPLSVVDCFSGIDEAIWTALRKEFNVTKYLALDVKEKRGRLKLDSLRYLQNQKWNHDVVDLDAYGSPWRHLIEVLKRGHDCLVFLTIGNTMFKGQQSEALENIGITFKIPIGLHAAIADLVMQHSLASVFDWGFAISSAYEALNPGGSARYFGLHLKKIS